MMDNDFRGYGAGNRLADALGVSKAHASPIRPGEAANLEKLAAHYGYVVGNEPGEWKKKPGADRARRPRQRASS